MTVNRIIEALKGVQLIPNTLDIVGNPNWNRENAIGRSTQLASQPLTRTEGIENSIENMAMTANRIIEALKGVQLILNTLNVVGNPNWNGENAIGRSTQPTSASQRTS